MKESHLSSYVESTVRESLQFFKSLPPYAPTGQDEGCRRLDYKIEISKELLLAMLQGEAATADCLMNLPYSNTLKTYVSSFCDELGIEFYVLQENRYYPSSFKNVRKLSFFLLKERPKALRSILTKMGISAQDFKEFLRKKP